MTTHYVIARLAPHMSPPKKLIYLYWPRKGYYEVHGTATGGESYTWFGEEDEIEVVQI